MSPWLIALPVVLPLVTACVGILLGASRPLATRIAWLGTFALAGASGLLLHRVAGQGIASVQFGDWPAPFGISFVADALAAVMVMITGVIALASVTYSLVTVSGEQRGHGFHPVLQLLLAGVNGAFLTGDLFNLYVWFEVLLISSFVLLSLGRSRAQIRGAVPYVILSLVSSMIFLSAVGLLYGHTGALNLAHLSLKLTGPGAQELPRAISYLFLGAFGIKAAIFPLFFWLPASYHTPPVAVSALFAGLLTKVGVYALIRVQTLLFPLPDGEPDTLLLVISGLTMLTGVLGAVAQNEFRKILSFHIVSQIGYMTMGLALNTRLGIAASVFYIVHHIIVKANLFLVSGIVFRLSGTFELKKLGGLYAARPGLALLFLVPAFSLAGVPPLSGFWGKLLLAKAGIESGSHVIVGVSFAAGLLTLFSMTKIWSHAFWAPLPEGSALASESPAERASLFLPVAALAAITLAIGLFTEPFWQFALRVADELADRSRYVSAVLPEGLP